MSRFVRKLIGGDATRAAIPIFLATMAWEAWALRRSGRTVELGSATEESNVDAPVGYESRDAAASVAMGLGSLVVNAAAGRWFEPLDSRVFRRRLFSLGARRGGFAAAVVVWDFLYYWNHRWGHEHRVFWAAHVNHHSSERYNLSTALRQSWSGPVMHWVFMPMLMLGFTPDQVARAGQINLLYQYWVHTETIDRFSPAFERVMNSASHHRVHHGANRQYLDRNYAGIFIVWDRMFRSFEPEGERIRYGLTKNITTFNPVRIAFHEWAAMLRDVAGASSTSERVGYVFGPPGWTPRALDHASDSAAPFEAAA